MKLKQISSIAPITIEEGMPIWQAARTMVNTGCHFLPVVKSGKPVGVVTGTDIAKRMVGRRFNTDEAPIDSIMSSPVITVVEDDEVEDALFLMRTNDLDHLVVVESNGDIQSVLSLADLVGRTDDRSITENLRRHVEVASTRPSHEFISTIPVCFLARSWLGR
jgi:CBS domain-containing protein